MGPRKNNRGKNLAGKGLFAALVFLLGLLALACAPARPAPSGRTPLPTATPPVMVIGATANPAAPTGTPFVALPESTPVPTPTATPSRISPTTGRTLETAKAFQPALVVIGNGTDTRPQTGLMQADVIYEMPMDRDGFDTRFLAVYADQYPEKVGPVQAARCYFAGVQAEWNGMFVFDGYPASEGYPYYALEDEMAPGMYSNASRRYFTQDHTVSTLPENTLFCNLSEMVSAIYGRYAPAVQARFTFRNNLTYDGCKLIDRVGLPFASRDPNRVVFVYEPADNLLYRYEKNSKDALAQSKTLTVGSDGTVTSEPVAVQNLIIQYVKYESLSDGYRDIVLTGTGNCAFFVNGRYVAGGWRRATLSDPTEYFLRDGSPLLLEPGATWIAFQTALRDVQIRFTSPS